MMGSPFDIVKDSSIWYNRASLKTTFQQDNTLYTGSVKSVFNDTESGELRYMVEVHYRGDTLPVACRMLRRWGGVFNYEDSIFRGYPYNAPAGLAAKAGDHVLVGLLGGQGREGVILGGLTHPTRQNLKADDGPQYRSEFNGVETYINKDGEYTLTFKGQPTNISDLGNAPSGPVPAPKYDTDVGGGYEKWDKTGSYTVTDAAKQNPQRFFIDKKNGTMELTAAATSLKITKDKSVEILAGSASFKLTKDDEHLLMTNKQTVVDSPDIKLGGAILTESALLATTYRAQQMALHTQLSTDLTLLAGFLNTAGQ